MKSVDFARFLAKKHLIFSPYFGRFLISVCESKSCKKLQNSRISEQKAISFKIIEAYECKCKANSEIILLYPSAVASSVLTLCFSANRPLLCV